MAATGVLLLLLGAVGGSECSPPPNATAYPLPPPPQPSPPLTVTVTGWGGQGPSCSPPGGDDGGLWVEPGPPSLTVPPGGAVTLRCRYRAPPGAGGGANVTWLRASCPRGVGGGGASCGAVRVGAGEEEEEEDGGGAAEARLVLKGAKVEDAGLYFCRVRLPGGAGGASCGTFVRVKEAPPSLLGLREATKNRVLVAQGALLLLCAVGPGLLLLLRKRWANERLLQGKKSLGEEENLYEGLAVGECSMYEAISRGGPQDTYQDVASLGGGGAGLEKP